MDEKFNRRFNIIFAVVGTIIATTFIGIIAFYVFVFKTVSDNGGVEKTLIKAGKEVKHISQEIDKQ